MCTVTSYRIIEYAYVHDSEFVSKNSFDYLMVVVLSLTLAFVSSLSWRGKTATCLKKKTTDVQMKPVTNYSEIYSVAVTKRPEKVYFNNDYSLLIIGLKLLPSLVVFCRVSLYPLVLIHVRQHCYTFI